MSRSCDTPKSGFIAYGALCIVYCVSCIVYDVWCIVQGVWCRVQGLPLEQVTSLRNALASRCTCVACMVYVSEISGSRVWSTELGECICLVLRFKVFTIWHLGFRFRILRVLVHSAILQSSARAHSYSKIFSTGICTCIHRWRSARARGPCTGI